MAINHGVNTYKSETSFTTVRTAASGIPFFIGAWPCHQGKGFVGKPQLVATYNEAVELGGYSDEWRAVDGAPKWNLCQAVYSHFKLFAMSPAIFYNVYDPATHKTSVSAESHNVVDHVVTLPGDVIDNESLIIKAGSSQETTLVKDTDYKTYYDEGNFYIELQPDSISYAEVTLSVAYDKANPEDITADDISDAVETVEMCKSVIGVVPDLICAPGWSSTSDVAAVMAAKAPSINGLYRAKAVVDIDTSSSGADSYENVITAKTTNGYTDSNMIVCWPMVKAVTKIFDMSTIVCGVIAKVDSANESVPFESPSNKTVPITGTCLSDGTEVMITLPQADVLSYTDGVVTAINNGGWVIWGNYTGCWPESTDVVEYFICTNRMLDFVCNTFVSTYWGYVDKPLTRVLIDAIVNSFNAWLNGLTHEGKLYGGQIQYIPDNNSTTDLLAGKFRLDTKMASPVPAQQINMYAEYDVAMLTAALNQ